MKIPVDRPTLAGEDAAWSRLGVVTVMVSGLAGAVDSFDTQMIGFTGRQISADLAFPMSHLGWVFGASQLGGVLGALLFGWLADRFGRSRMLIVACLIAAGFTAASLAAPDLHAFLLLRVMTGFGLGGVMPCFLSLGVEAMPAPLRLGLTPILYASFPVGGIAGAWISAPVLIAYGWRGVFAMAAGSLAFIAALVIFLPLAEHKASGLRQKSARPSALLRKDLVRVTLWLWGLFLLAPSGIYLLVLWMPSLIQLMGVSAARAGVLVGFLNVGGLVGAVVGGWALVRFGRLRVIGSFLLIGTLGFPLIGVVHGNWPALIAVCMLAGAAIAGTLSLLVSMAANAIRRTCAPAASALPWAWRASAR